MIKVSVIIATYNRAPHLIKALESLMGQSLPADMWEAVAVDNNCTDDTAALFERLVEDHPRFNFRMVKEPSQGLSHARNRGIAESAGELIVIMDDDEEADKDFLSSYYDFFTRHAGASAAGGVMRPVYEKGRPRWMSFITEGFISSAIDLGGKERLFPAGKYPIGGNFAFRREAVDRVGTFDPQLGRKGEMLMAGEEKDFIDRLRRAGGEVWWLPSAVILHHIPASRLTREYFDKVTLMIGRSERVRTRNISAGAYRRRLTAEIFKWGAAVVLAFFYLITLRPAKSAPLLRMRINVTKGLLGRFPVYQ